MCMHMFFLSLVIFIVLVVWLAFYPWGHCFFFWGHMAYHRYYFYQSFGYSDTVNNFPPFSSWDKD